MALRNKKGKDDVGLIISLRTMLTDMSRPIKNLGISHESHSNRDVDSTVEIIITTSFVICPKTETSLL